MDVVRIKEEKKVTINNEETHNPSPLIEAHHMKIQEAIKVKKFLAPISEKGIENNRDFIVINTIVKVM